MKKIYVYISLFLLTSMLGQSSLAQVIASDVILEFKNTDRLIRTIAVGNFSENSALKINTKITEVLNPASNNTKQIETDAIFTVPENFVLKPRSQRAIRIVSKERPKNKERIFRIVFAPTAIKNNKIGDSQLNILTTTAVMMILNPPKPQENLTWDRKETYILFTNKGNTNVVLRSKGFCAQDIKCTIKGRRLWAGDQWKLNLPEDLRELDITLEMRALGEIKEIVIPYND